MKSILSFIVIALITFSGDLQAQSRAGGPPLSNPTFQIRGSSQLSSGQPGGGLSFLIRGQASVDGNAEPLFVIDGLIVNRGTTSLTENLLASLDPEDIAEIKVLKDAAAAAIYGAQSANGVVIITTKKGTADSTKL